VNEPQPRDEPTALVRQPYHVRIAEDRWATLRHIVEAVAIVGAGIWAFYTFIYQEQIKPAHEPAALTASVAVRGLGHDRLRDFFGLTLFFHNTGKTEIDIAADGYNVWGEHYGTRPAIHASHERNRRWYRATLPIVSRQLIAALVELRDVAVGGRVATHIIMEPDASDNIQSVFAVPRGAYDLIHAQVIAVPVKRSMQGKIAIAIQTYRDGSYMLTPPTDFEEDDNTTDYVIVH
jgi:hypothetical protein